MVINLDPFNHNNYNEATTPQRIDNGDESLNESRESVNDERIKLDELIIKDEDDLDFAVSLFKVLIYYYMYDDDSIK